MLKFLKRLFTRRKREVPTDADGYQFRFQEDLTVRCSLGDNWADFGIDIGGEGTDFFGLGLKPMRVSKGASAEFVADARAAFVRYFERPPKGTKVTDI